jgi:dCMP deaminase
MGGIMSRVEWDEYFMDLAVMVASRSTCLRKQHGAVIVKDKQVLSTGYNGTPSKVVHCNTCFREEHNIPHGTMYELCRSVHAEMNAITLAAKNGIAINGADMYITGMPCIMCSRLIINAGIKTIYISADEHEKDYGAASAELLKEGKVQLKRVE